METVRISPNAISSIDASRVDQSTGGKRRRFPDAQRAAPLAEPASPFAAAGSYFQPAHWDNIRDEIPNLMCPRQGKFGGPGGEEKLRRNKQ